MERRGGGGCEPGGAPSDAAPRAAPEPRPGTARGSVRGRAPGVGMQRGRRPVAARGPLPVGHLPSPPAHRFGGPAAEGCGLGVPAVPNAALLPQENGHVRLNGDMTPKAGGDPTPLNGAGSAEPPREDGTGGAGGEDTIEPAPPADGGEAKPEGAAAPKDTPKKKKKFSFKKSFKLSGISFRKNKKDDGDSAASSPTEEQSKAEPKAEEDPASGTAPQEERSGEGQSGAEPEGAAGGPGAEEEKPPAENRGDAAAAQQPPEPTAAEPAAAEQKEE